MTDGFGYQAKNAVTALAIEDQYVWDCAVIRAEGKYHMFSSGWDRRLGFGWNWLFNSQVFHSVSDTPEGPFTRLTEDPILQFADENLHVEDPYIWYDEHRKKFCLIAKDDCKNGSSGITGEWGGGFYAESNDCIHFEIAENPKVYSRTVTWKDGHTSVQGNLERPYLLFDESGKPTHLFCASGNASTPYDFQGNTFIMCMMLE